MDILTVSQINKYIGSKIKGDKILQGILIKGEISNFVHHYKSGHFYFTLKDENCSIKAIMFASSASKLKFSLEDGMMVIALGSISVFERDGIYQVYVNSIQPFGVGDTQVAIEQLKKKLQKEGLFDSANKRQIPQYPKKIGAVTSSTGAAIQDIINVLSRRYPIGELVIINALVQGVDAPKSICEGIIKAENLGCDVIIVGRGGGSTEDLSAFNTESVAYAIYNSKVPIISAVGHEVDYTIADLVADLRAPTPSAAAEMASADIQQIYATVDYYSEKLKGNIKFLLDKKTDSYTNINNKLSRYSPENSVKINFEKLDALEKRCNDLIKKKLEQSELTLSREIVKLDSLSPLKVLSRGYSLVYKEEKLLNSVDDVEINDNIVVRLGKGKLEASVIKIDNEV